MLNLSRPHLSSGSGVPAAEIFDPTPLSRLLRRDTNALRYVLNHFIRAAERHIADMERASRHCDSSDFMAQLRQLYSGAKAIGASGIIAIIMEVGEESAWTRASRRRAHVQKLRDAIAALKQQLEPLPAPAS